MCLFKDCGNAQPLMQPDFGPPVAPVPIGDSGLMLLGAVLGVAVLKRIRRNM